MSLVSLEAMAAVLPAGVERWRASDRAAWKRMRQRDITASIVGALVDVHDFASPFSVWAEKSGKVKPDAEETAAMERGTLLEPVAVELIRRRHPDWTILYPVDWYYREAANRVGCTPDVFVLIPGRPGFFIIQIKSAEPMVFRQKWQQDGTITPPLWISMQAVTEATLTGASGAMVGVLRVGHGLDFDLIEVPLHMALMNRLRRESLAMWSRIERDDPPPVTAYGDDRDGRTIRALYPNADEGLMKDLTGNNRVRELLARRLELQARESDGAAATKERRAIDAEFIHLLQDAAYGSVGDGRVVAAKVRRTAHGKTSRTITIQGDRNERRRQASADRGQLPAPDLRSPF